MRKWSSFALLASALLSACGGGGSAAGTDAPVRIQAHDLGSVRADQPTTTKLEIGKPFYPPAIVEMVGVPSGPFAPAGGMLPMHIGSGQDAVLWVTFTPPGGSAGLQEGTIPLVFRPVAGGDPVEVKLVLRVIVETPSVHLMQTQVFAGSATVGETLAFGVAVENTSVATPIYVTGAEIGEGEFSLAAGAPALPIAVAPGSRFVVPLAYTPTGEWSAESTIRIYHSISADPLEATVRGSGIPPLAVVDFGDVPLDPFTFESDWMTLNVPAQAVSIHLEAWGDPAASLIDLIGFEGPLGAVYETYDGSGPLGWLAGYPAGAAGYLNVALPDSNNPAVQLMPGGGNYRFRLRDTAFGAGSLLVRATIVQRAAAPVAGTLDLRVFLSQGLGIADPATDAKLTTTLRAIDGLLGMAGIRIGSVSYVQLTEPAYDTIADETQLGDLLAAATAGLPEGPLNLFFVGDLSYGIAGVSGSVPGPRSNGTRYSGVVMDFGAGDGLAVGAASVHEIYDYLGVSEGVVLFHQADVFAALRHPILLPGLPAELLSPPETTDDGALMAAIYLLGPTDGWCGTCLRMALR